MKNGLDMVTEAFKIANTSDFTSVISGGIYKLKRPQNSLLEDIVINALAITGNQIQDGVININIHAPNIQNQTFKGGKPDSTMPDTDKLQRIAKVVEAKFGKLAGNDFRMWIDQPGKPYNDNDGSWYINIRVNYLFFQKSYTNI